MSGKPIRDLQAIARVEDGKRIPCIVVNDSTGIDLPFLLRKIIYADISACVYLGIGSAKPSYYAMASGQARTNMLQGECPRSGLRGLVDSLMPDTLKDIMCHAHIRTRHRQGLGEYLPLAGRIDTAEMAGPQYECHATTHKLQALQFTKPMTVDAAAFVTATRT